REPALAAEKESGLNVSARCFLCFLLCCALAACGHQPVRRPSGKTKRAVYGACHPLSPLDRELILQIADPQNFPRTRYPKARDLRRPMQEETDCSHFVHEVYARAGLPYSFRSTKDILRAPEFERVPETQSQPGDVIVMRGHIGLLDEDKKVISA